MLATRVGGELLWHGHGAPLRLVAPGRRGYDWVKWVDEVRLVDSPHWFAALAAVTVKIGNVVSLYRGQRFQYL